MSAGGMTRRTTLKNKASCTGVGLHTGAPARLALVPAEAGTGRVFERTDLSPPVLVAATLDHASSQGYGTSVSAGGAVIETVEHLLAALSAYGVDDVVIRLHGPECPAVDGAAAAYCALIEEAGLNQGDAPAPVFEILEPVEFTRGERRAVFEPAPGFEVDISIAFDDLPAIGRQSYAAQVDAEAFRDAIAPARTFARLSDYKALRAAGRSQGGSVANAILVDGSGILNKEGLRFEDEFARHKALDAIGDLALLGAPLKGRFLAERPGHAFNLAAMRALMAAAHAWKLA